MKHERFFSNIRHLDIDLTISSDISKLLLEYDTVLDKHILLKDNEMVSVAGKKIIENRTSSKIDYYYELLRIYYVNYKKTKDQFKTNNIQLKKDCMKFIKDNNITIVYNDDSSRDKTTPTNQNKTNPTTDPTTDQDKTDSTTDPTADQDKQYQSKRDEQSKREQKRQEQAKQKQEKQEQQKVLEIMNDMKQTGNYDKWAIVLYENSNNNKYDNHDDINNKNKRTAEFWKKIYKIICLFTHPDKTQSPVLHYLFSLALTKYQKGQHYYLIFIMKILEIDKYLSKKYRNLEQKHTKKYVQTVNEFENTLTEFWEKRMYYVKCPVYNYNTMSEINKIKVVKFCLTKNMLEFRKYSAKKL
jgi:hypothetical protein